MNREYLQNLARLRAGMAPVGGLTILQKPDGSLGEHIEHWSQEQLETIALIERQIASVSERYGLTEQEESGDDTR